MQVNLTQDEIAKAVKLFLKEQGIKLQNKDVSIQFSMGKGVNGLKSEVNIEDNPNAPVVVDEDPVRVLDTVREEPEIKPSSVNALIKRHAEEVVAKTAATVAVKPVEELAAATEAQGQAIDAAIAAEDEPNMGMPSDPPFEADVIQNGDQQLAAEPAAEAAPVTEAGPAIKVRKAIFGKKPAAEPVPVAATAPEPAQAEDDSAALAMPGDEEVKPEVAAEVVKPAVATGPRRSAASLFKKPSA